MSVLPRCICDPIEAMGGNYDPRCNRHSAALDSKRIEQLAYIMAFLQNLGFDLETVKRAADAWWAMKAGSAGVALGAPGDTDAERAAWLADKIVAGGDYAKEAAQMLRRWPTAGVETSDGGLSK